MADTPLTTNTHLTQGVGEFYPVPEGVLKDLMTNEEKSLGLDGTGLAQFHSAAWERAKSEFAKPPILVSITTELSSSATTMVQSFCCCLIMEGLHRRMAFGNPESWNTLEAERYQKWSDEIMSRAQTTIGGRTVPLGGGVPLYRG